MGYNFTAQWLKGSKNEAADALSRHPHQSPHEGDDLAEYELDSHYDSPTTAIKALSFSQVRELTLQPFQWENLHLQELQQHANKDQEYQALKDIIMNGFPNQKASLADPLKKFWAIKDNLTIDDGFIVYGCCLFIPTSLRASMLSRLHEAHQGITRSKDVATVKITYHLM